MIEKDVKRQLKKLLNDAKVFWYMPVPTGFSKAGVPDFLVCANGRFIGIETKAPNRRGEKGGGLSPIQARCRDDIQASGGIFILYDGEDDHVTYLKGILNECSNI